MCISKFKGICTVPQFSVWWYDLPKMKNHMVIVVSTDWYNNSVGCCYCVVVTSNLKQLKYPMMIKADIGYKPSVINCNELFRISNANLTMDDYIGTIMDPQLKNNILTMIRNPFDPSYYDGSTVREDMYDPRGFNLRAKTPGEQKPTAVKEEVDAADIIVPHEYTSKSIGTSLGSILSNIKIEEPNKSETISYDKFEAMVISIGNKKITEYINHIPSGSLNTDEYFRSMSKDELMWILAAAVKFPSTVGLKEFGTSYLYFKQSLISYAIRNIHPAFEGMKLKGRSNLERRLKSIKEKF